MKSISLGEVGLSLVGLVALIQALILFPRLVSIAAYGLTQSGALLVGVVTILSFAVLVSIGTVLITRPAPAARLLWSGESPGPAVPDELALLLFAAVGVMVFAAAIPDLVERSFEVAENFGSSNRSVRVFVAAVARALLGLVLFFRPGAILGIWRRQQLSRDSRDVATPPPLPP